MPKDSQQRNNHLDYYFEYENEDFLTVESLMKLPSTAAVLACQERSPLKQCGLRDSTHRNTAEVNMYQTQPRI